MTVGSGIAPPLLQAHRLLFALGLLLATGALAQDSADGPVPLEVIELTTDGVRELRFAAEVGTVFIADPETADVRVLDSKTLFVLGRKVGKTELKVQDIFGQPLADYRVRVNAVPEDARIAVVRLAGDESPIRVDAIGESLFVTGSAESPSEAERVLRGIRAVAGETPVVDAVKLSGPAQVNLEVLISEVSRSVSHSLGIDWSVDLNPFAHPLRTWITGEGMRLGTGALQVQPVNEQTIEFGSPLDPDATFSTETVELGVVNPARGGDGGIVLSHSELFDNNRYRATVFLEALADNGLAVVHARPNLTAVSGQTAEFFSGLEVPVPTVTERGLVGTEYQEVGVGLNFTPRVIRDDQISLTVAPRIRELAAGGTTIAGAVVPNISERSVTTTVELGDGESIAIAGLYRRNTLSDAAGVPLLKDIPLWGALFRNMAERDQSVELIIVVTPRLVAAVPAAAALAQAASDAPGATALQLANEFYY